MVRRDRRKRGIVLLIVLSLLAIFTLMAATFLIVAGNYRTAAAAAATTGPQRAHPKQLTEEVLFSLLVDSNDPRSVIRGHSLLRDMYGDDGFTATVQGATRFARTRRGVPMPNVLLGGGQFFDVDLVTELTDASIADVLSRSPAELNNLAVYPHDLTGAMKPLQRNAGFYNGQLLTFTSGPLKGVTTRIIGYFPEQSRFRLMLLDESVLLPPDPTLAGSRIVVNGRPFSGSGFRTIGTGADLTTVPALQPNRSTDASPAIYLNYLFHGADESYDAADYQNMHMAAFIPIPGAPPNSLPFVLPSFHRPALINRWLQVPGMDDPTIFATVQSRITLRPSSVLNPNFDGSNPNFPAPINPLGPLVDPTTSEWDVDNDGDGVPDSIWVDVGLPIQQDRHGRLYKPLAAILCTDLDGRLNINAQGGGGRNLTAARLPTNLAGNPNLAAVDATTGPILGRGTGPADINLAEFFGPSLGILENTRNGADNVAGVPGIDRSTQHRTDINSIGNGGFEQGPDLSGDFIVGVDHRGQPSFSRPPPFFNHPYEKNLVAPQAADQIFSVSELEGLLRLNDDDQTAMTGKNTPQRLTTLFPNLFVTPLNAALNRRLVTTHSFDLPVPNMAPPHDFWNSDEWFDNISSILRRRMRDTVPADRMDLEVGRMLSTDLLMGLRMDVSRPFGNGMDDNSNGVFDEFEESRIPERNSALDAATTFFDHDNDGAIGGDARGLYARNLYVLLMMFKDRLWQVEDGPRETARLLAQWAVNAVDFRDSDAIMTPFEYDLLPFDGWNVDGNIATDEGAGIRGVVWGTERPEMVITETLAFHDRRATDDEIVGGGTVADGRDDTLDQVFEPVGSFYVELYNPWASAKRKPAEFYRTSNNDVRPGIVLDKRTPNDYAVWRLLVVSGDTVTDFDRSDLNPPGLNTTDRAIYFGCRRGGAGAIPNPLVLASEGASVFPQSSADATITSTRNEEAFLPLVPGRYAVIGTVRAGEAGSWVNPIGKLTTLDDDTLSRRIVMDVTAGAISNTIRVEGNQSDATDVAGEPEALTDILPAVTVPIQDLNITERLNSGYDYSVLPSDIPFDDLEDDEHPMQPGMHHYGDPMSGWDKVAHLQRLANPLQDWDPILNPYRTIDSMEIDLRVFNGDFTESPAAGVEDEFHSRERGDPVTRNRPLWNRVSGDALLDNPTRDTLLTPGKFNRKLAHSLGYLNKSYGTTIKAADPRATDVSYVGAPAASPFPWLTWLNRPYTSQYEMTLVPRSSSFNLLNDWGVRDRTRNPYQPDVFPDYVGEFGHLLNFYTASTTGPLPNFAQLFDFTHVPSHFAGTYTRLNPVEFAKRRTDTARFHAPFNRISKYREPGKINLNSASDPVIINAIRGSGDNRARGPLFGAIQQSIGIDMFQNDASFFKNPFRGYGPPVTFPVTATAPTRPTDATFLRSSPGLQHVPFLAPQVASIQQHNDPDINPYFRYEPLQRFANLSTTRSNVYAIWITVGFFEVENTQPDPLLSPFGYQLGAEVGWDTGDIRRHRSFYVIDRSIPVAFEPGKRHNAEKTILVRRFIE